MEFVSKEDAKRLKVEEKPMKRVEPCETCANRPGCKFEFGGTSCHYYPAWGSPAFDRIRDQAREATRDRMPRR